MTRSHAVLALSALVLIQTLSGQQAPTSTPTLATALSAIGGAGVQSLNLSGSAESIAGATDVTGTFSANCAVSGASQLNLQLSNGSLTETRQVTNGLPTGNWIDSQGVQHQMVLSNLLTPQPWFCPLIVLSEIVSASTLNIQFVGNEVKNGANALHFTVVTPYGAGPSQPQLMQHLSQLDLYLDPQTLLPLVFDFNIHPDNNSSLDIPVEVQFSNFTLSGGVWFPNTTQEYINSSLALSLQVQSATPSLNAQQ